MVTPPGNRTQELSYGRPSTNELCLISILLTAIARRPKVWPPLINSHFLMQTLTNHKSRTVSSWLLIRLNLFQRMWINQKRSICTRGTFLVIKHSENACKQFSFAAWLAKTFCGSELVCIGKSSWLNAGPDLIIHVKMDWKFRALINQCKQDPPDFFWEE